MKPLQKYIDAQADEESIKHQIITHGIDLVMPSKKQLNIDDAKLYLQNTVLFQHYHSLVKQLLNAPSIGDCIGVENIKRLIESLGYFKKIALQLNKSTNSYLSFIEDCQKLLLKIEPICHTNFFTYENNPVILELKDYLASIEKQDEIHQKISKSLYVISQLGAPFLGTNNQNEHRELHLPNFTAAKKLIALLEHKKGIVFNANEVISLFKGRLGLILEKYHVRSEFIEQHMEKNLLTDTKIGKNFSK